ncbi:MAG: alpha-ketoglutarate-dependent dioxygenase AlkB [Bacteroidota bacterium]
MTHLDPTLRLALTCEVSYYEDFLSAEEAHKLFQELTQDERIFQLRLKGFNDIWETFNFGKIIFLDQDLYEGNKFPEPIWGPTAVWPDKLREVKERVELLTGISFGVGVCIYYPDGASGVDFHSDSSAYGDTSVLPSLSLGEEREFCLKEKKTQKVTGITLQHGSLIIMGNGCQDLYEHALPVNPIYQQSRINVTFRQYDRSA